MKKVLAFVLSIAVILTMGLSVLSVSAADQVIYWTLDEPSIGDMGGGWNGIDPNANTEDPIDMTEKGIESLKGWFGVMEGKNVTAVKVVVDGKATALTEEKGLESAEDAVKNACNAAFGTISSAVGYATRFTAALDSKLTEGDHSVELIATVDGEDVVIISMSMGDGYQGSASDPTDEPTNTSKPTEKPADSTKAPDKKPDNSKTGDSSIIFVVAAAGIVLTVLAKKKLSA